MKRLRCAVLLLVAAQALAAEIFSGVRLREIDATIERAIADEQFEGGVFWLERDGEFYRKTYGRRAVLPESEVMTVDTIFDMASLTKVMATTPSIMILVEEGKIRLDEPVATYLPEFTDGRRENVTVRHLLTHTSGLRAGLVQRDWSGYARGVELAAAERPLNNPGTSFVYSDLNFILLGEMVRRVSGEPLDQFARRRIFEPLRMHDTGFNPPAAKIGRVAPTEFTEERQLLRGRVHDPTARRMGGVAGHAGLFSTAADLARYARMLLGEGKLGDVRIFRPETVKLMTSVQTEPSVRDRRALGWDLDSSYSGPRGLFPLGSFGHTGWTGTSIWIDPSSKSFYAFLSNGVHPDGRTNVRPLRRVLGTLSAEALTGLGSGNVHFGLQPRTKVETLNGIDVLAADGFAQLRGLRIGLITNHTGRDRNGTSTIDLLHRAPDVKLVALFSPEHGIRGDRDEKISDEVDSKTGLKVFSLYGESRKPRAEQLSGLDALVFDVQDIGARFYTYISTLGHAMEAAADADVRVFVLDRINPINGSSVEGPMLDGGQSFIAYHWIVLRHAMTVGELARMFAAERAIDVDLTVVPVRNWSRTLWHDDTWIPWVNTSPNIRSLAAATLYPGVCLLERTEMSVGRGTATPFEIVGAPYIDEKVFAAALESEVLPGVRFEPVRFTPDASVFKGQECGGVRMRITNRDALNSVDLGITLVRVLHRLYGQSFSVAKVDDLLKHPGTIEALRRGDSLHQIRGMWAAGQSDFRRRREKYLLYR